jgi:hypothetical protein
MDNQRKLISKINEASNLIHKHHAEDMVTTISLVSI